MRFVAKASSAGSTQRQATGLGRIFRGAFATRGASLSFDGSGAPSHAPAHKTRFLLASLAALVLTLAFCASPASAAKVPLFDFGAAGTQGGQLNTPRGVAVNQNGAGSVTAGTVYVVDFNNNRIQRFEPDGSFVAAWGHDVETGGGTGYEVCTTAANCKAGVAGSAAGQFNGIAGGIAVDQNNGNVSILDRTNRRIQQFSATGAFIRTWGLDVDSTGGAGFEICETAANCKAGIAGTAAGALNTSASIAGIATDSAGNLYVADASTDATAVSARVQKFGPNGGFLAMGGWDVDSVSPSTAYEVCTVAADCKAGTPGTGLGQFTSGTPSFLAASPAGDVYVVVGTPSPGKIVRLDSSLALIDGEFAPALVPGGTSLRAIAVNPADGHVFIAKQATDTNITEIDPATESLVATHPAGAPNWVGLAVNEANGRVYAAATGAFIRALEEGPPTATIAAATSNTGTRATLNGAVNPNGTAVTECFFEYGKTTSYGQTAPCVPSAASIGDGTSPVPVQADVSGLVPNGTTYHFRLVATNPKGTARSPNQSFTTLNTVATTAATAVTNAGATLNGTVNPDTVALTECAFEYGTTTAYGQTAPCAETPASIGTGTSPVPVHADVAGLNPFTVYHFRLKVTYGGGIGAVNGNDLSLQTLGPRVLATWSEDVVLTEAFLKAEIDPEGKATTYRFEYGKTDSYGQQTPELAVGSDSNPHKVSRFLEGLEPGTTYHYRVIATNADAVNEGPDRTFTTFSRISPGVECPNQALRVGPSANLPDCRAYEMVSPMDKNGGDIETPVQEIGAGSHASSSYRQVSIAGGKITYSSGAAFADAVGSNWSNQYISSRGPEGWSTDAINQPRGITVLEPTSGFNANFRWFAYSFFQGFAPDLSSAWVRDDNKDTLTPDALQGFVNLYHRDNLTEAYQALTNEGPYGPIQAPGNFNGPGVRPDLGSSIASGGPRFIGASEDLQHQVFAVNAPLTADAREVQGSESPKVQLYDLVDGELHLVSVLPDGTAATTNSFAGAISSDKTSTTREQMVKNTVSDDGSRIFWTATATSGGPGTIYVRENPGEEQSAIVAGACTEPDKACTFPVSGSVGAGASQYWAAAADGSKVIFSQGAHPNRTLYLFDAETKATPTQIAGGARGVVATAEDLSHVYFLSSEAKAPGAIAGQNNLYDYHEGDYVLVGTVSSDDVTSPSQTIFNSGALGGGLGGFGFNGSPTPILNQTRVTPDGGHFAFMSNSRELSESAAGYDNTDVVTGKPDFEVYRYDAEAEELNCVSCNPSGARPRGHLPHVPYSPLDLEFTAFPDLRVAASIPTHEHDNYASRILSDDGSRLFFHTDEALLPRDTNGIQDVYLWQAPGTGECEVGDADYFERNDGCLYLISTGRDDAKSEFVDATPSGDEAYISVDESLDPRDPGLRDIYLAKVGGGYPMPRKDAICEGEACQSPPAPPDDPTPNSLSFQGPGNPAAQGAKPKARCPKGKRRVKARGGKTRCVKRKQSAKQTKSKKRANDNRRAGR